MPLVWLFYQIYRELSRGTATTTIGQIPLFQNHLTYHFSKRIAHREKQRQELAAMIGRALAHLATCESPDWYAARQEFSRTVRR